MAQCPSCGRDVRDDAAFCNYCGAKVVADPNPAPVTTVASSAQDYWVCSQCSIENAAEDRFCSSCGTERADAAAQAPSPAQYAFSPAPSAQDYWVCPRCSVENTVDAAFCSNCGVARAETAQPGASSVQPADAGPWQATAAAPPTHASRRWILIVAVLAAVAVGAGMAFVLLRPEAGTGGGDAPASASGGAAASSQASSTSATGSEQSDMVTFLQDVKALIHDAGQGRSGIGDATAAFRSGNIGRSEATRKIQAVIDNRSGVIRGLEGLTLPDDPRASRCVAAFRRAMKNSRAADERYLDWVNGVGAESEASYFNEQSKAWKVKFTGIYDSLAAAEGMRHDYTYEDL
jgi:hypothetical protein